MDQSENGFSYKQIMYSIFQTKSAHDIVWTIFIMYCSQQQKKVWNRIQILFQLTIRNIKKEAHSA